ncbi:LIM/homeobox protein Lhx9-like [Styela clava]
MLLELQEASTGYMQIREDMTSEHVTDAFSVLSESQTSPEDHSLHNEQSPGPSVCSGCGYYIFDQSYLLMTGKAWHTDCLKCSMCACTLNSANSCFMKDGNILCKEDYYSSRLQTSRTCAGCGCWISAEDLIMKARELIYHVACFTCITCRRILVPGERFSIDQDTGRLHCCNCWKHAEYCNQANGPNPQFPSYYEDESGRKPGKRKGEPSLSIETTSGLAYGSDYRESFPPQKTKRMRTSFKHHQLRSMRSYFNMNRNPDAKDLKQLAQETGLTKRVLQVWFQNARAKYRRGKGLKGVECKKSDEGEHSNIEKETDQAGQSSKDTNSNEDQMNGDETGDCDVTSNSENDEAWLADNNTSAVESLNGDIPNISSEESSVSQRSDTVDSNVHTAWSYNGTDSNNNCTLGMTSNQASVIQSVASSSINGNAVYGFHELAPTLQPTKLLGHSDIQYGDKPLHNGNINGPNAMIYAPTGLFDDRHGNGFLPHQQQYYYTTQFVPHENFNSVD